jgi:hypothetical protein
LPTVRTAADNRCQVEALCTVCDHVSRLDLTKLAALGYGDVALVELPLRRVCASKPSRIIVSGRAYS